MLYLPARKAESNIWDIGNRTAGKSRRQIVLGAPLNTGGKWRRNFWRQDQRYWKTGSNSSTKMPTVSRHKKQRGVINKDLSIRSPKDLQEVHSLQHFNNKGQDRWIECVEEVLNRPSPEVAADIPPAEVDSEVKSLKKGNAPGLDNLGPELFNAHPVVAASILQQLFYEIWKGERILEEW